MTSKIYQTNNAANDKDDTILSARIQEYQNPLAIERIPKPTITSGDQVLVKVAASGLCHSDLHLVNGEWKNVLPIPLPITPGHEVAGWVEEIGDSVPQGFLDKGDLVAIFGGWGCGVCIVQKGMLSLSDVNSVYTFARNEVMQ